VILLYLTLVYFLGILLGRMLWDSQWIGCSFPTTLWLIPLVLLALTPLLNHRPRDKTVAAPALRWPVSAGFAPVRQGPSLALIAALLLCLCTGVLRYASAPLTPCWQPDDLARYNLPADRAYDRSAPQVLVTGYVSSYPLVSDTSQRLHVAAQTVHVDGRTRDVRGDMRLTTGTHTRYAYGQPIRLRGRLVTPPDFDDFSYREYLARKGVHSLFYSTDIEVRPGPLQGNRLLRALFALRARGEALLNRLLPEPYAALANGMLLGIESGIPDALYDQFNLTGTSHVIVISGSNVALIAGVLLALGTRLFGKRHAVWPALVGIACYALLVGGDAAVLRAALMGGLFVVATALQRQSTALISLSAACWAMTLLNPLTLWDVGFQLSSAATAGLIVFTPGITAFFDKLAPGFGGGHLTGQATGLVETGKGLMQGLIQDGLLVTLAANITTLPLVVYYFGRLSIVSLLTNLLIAPAQPFIMLWGSAAIVLGVLGLVPVAWLILLVPWLSLVWTVFMVRWTAALPGASLEIAEYGLGALLVTYAIIFAVHWRQPVHQWLHRVRDWGAPAWSTRIVKPATLGALGVGCVLIWSVVLTRPDGRLHVYFLDIGQGDGIFIQTPSGNQVLIDGGSSPQALFSELGAVMPFWDRSIDLTVLTHPDGDHMDALAEAPRRFQITTALETADSRAHPDAVYWREQMRAAGVDVQVQHAGGWIDLGDGVALWVLWPESVPYVGENRDNENSLVLKLVYGEFSVLLTGDIGHPAEQRLLHTDAPLASTVLKVGHHGSKGSSAPAFVRSVNAQLAVIQLGADNDYGHPHQEALENLAGRPVLRNDRHGRVHVWSDGRRMWVDVGEGVFEVRGEGR